MLHSIIDCLALNLIEVTPRYFLKFPLAMPPLLPYAPSPRMCFPEYPDLSCFAFRFGFHSDNFD